MEDQLPILFFLFGSIVSGTTAAVLGSQAQRSAAKRAAKSTQRTNALNLSQSLYSKGADLSGVDLSKFGIPKGLLTRGGVVLPQYGAETERQLFEQAAAMAGSIAAMNGTPELQAETYKALITKYGPDSANNDQLASDLASGKVTNDMLAEAEPVFAARIGVAEGRKNAGLEAIQKSINNIRTAGARKGYSGDSSGTRQLEFNARRDIGTRGADDLSMALLQNELERAGLKTQGRNMRLANINLPDTLLRSRISRMQLPTETVAKNYTTSMSPFGFFNQNPTQFRGVETPPTGGPTVSPFEAIARTGGAVGNTLANYYLQKQLQDQIGAGGSGYTGYQPTSGAGTAAAASALNSAYSSPDWWTEAGGF